MELQDLKAGGHAQNRSSKIAANLAVGLDKLMLGIFWNGTITWTG
jgi:hypothetical protein